MYKLWLMHTYAQVYISKLWGRQLEKDETPLHTMQTVPST